MTRWFFLALFSFIPIRWKTAGRKRGQASVAWLHIDILKGAQTAPGHCFDHLGSWVIKYESLLCVFTCAPVSFPLPFAFPPHVPERVRLVVSPQTWRLCLCRRVFQGQRKKTGCCFQRSCFFSVTVVDKDKAAPPPFALELAINRRRFLETMQIDKTRV